MQKTDCDGLRIECAFTVEEAKYICGLDKDVRASFILNEDLIYRILKVYAYDFPTERILNFISDGTMSRIHAQMAFQF